MASIRVTNLTKSLESIPILAGVSLDVAQGEMLFLLGPGGSGKSTLLRIISGSVEPDVGKVFINEVDVTRSSAYTRGIGIVPQNNVLWPHLGVRENIAFSLGQQHLPAEDIRRAVHSALGAVGLDGVGDRKPAKLSESEQQRAGLARVFAINPKVLLLDEPFSDLDARQKRTSFDNVQKFCREQNIAVICATQDHRSAFSFADRIAVLIAGRIHQIASPLEIYRRPKTRFVADFVSAANLIDGTIIHAGAGEFIAQTKLGEIRGALSDPEENPESGTPIDIAIRPEAIHLDVMAPEENAFQGEITGTEYFGGSAWVYFKTAAGITLRVVEQNPRTTGSSNFEATCAWVAPEDIIGIIRKHE
ncbi:MAG: ABC transporter ATP-binding protein [Puniceicoccales bacterium]|nr:ABC transporter ATP-binding protein [Puniceicoccales bacterium]